MRKQGNCLEKEIMQRTMPGARRLGRPRTAWMDNIKTWTGLSVEESIRMTEGRDKWRKYVHGSRTAKEQNRTIVWYFVNRLFFFCAPAKRLHQPTLRTVRLLRAASCARSVTSSLRVASQLQGDERSNARISSSSSSRPPPHRRCGRLNKAPPARPLARAAQYDDKFGQFTAAKDTGAAAAFIDRVAWAALSSGRADRPVAALSRPV